MNLSKRQKTEELRRAEEKVLELYKKEVSLRDQFLKEEAEQRGIEGDQETAQAIKIIRKRERRNREFRFLKGILKRRHEDSVPEVEVPDGCNTLEEMWDRLKNKREDPKEWKTIGGREKVEAILVEWCKLHFGQAAETPLTKGQWEKHLNVLGKENKVREILEGGNSALNIDVRECVEWVDGLRSKNIETTELQVEENDFRRFIQKVRESKSSSPSGRHYGHYKVLDRDPELRTIAFRIMELALRRGVVLQRWKIVHQILLPKDTDGSKIHRFRNITLVEADLMFVMRKVWARDLANRVAKAKGLHQAQYARKGQIAQMSVLNKRLSYDLQLTLREDAFQADNDAANCYDRIVDNVAAIATMRMGLSSRAARFMKETLVSFKHSILIGGQPSERSFSNSLLQRIHGTGQGTGWSPVIWSVVCDVIIEVMETNQPGQVFFNPTKEIKASQTIDAFVDDSNLSVNETGVREYNKKRGTNLSIEEASRQAYQAYERYLFVSGGKLALHKCRFYWITFLRRSKKYIFSLKAPKKFVFGEGFSTRRVRLKQLDASEPHKILGMWVSPTGDQEQQVKEMTGKVEKWGEKMQSWKVPPPLRVLSYRTALWPALKYPLGVCQLETGHVKKIMGPLLPILKWSNYVSEKFSTRLMYTPMMYGGYGVVDIEKANLVEQVKMMLSALRQGDNTGKKLKVLIEYHQLESGVGKSVLEQGGEVDFLLTETWVTKLVRKLRNYGMWIKTRHWVPVEEGMKTLMEIFIEKGKEKDELEKLNLCRMHFNVLWVDDVYGMDGSLCKSAKDLQQSESTLEWPKTPIPKRWETWWWAMLADGLPQRKGALKWKYRESRAKTSPDKKYAVVQGKTYREMETRSRARIFEEVQNMEQGAQGALCPCMVEEAGKGRIKVIDAEVPVEMVSPMEQRRPVWVPWGEQDLNRAMACMEGDAPCCYSDASVDEEVKAVAVWFGQKEGEGVMLTHLVEGLPHDSGRGELAGPVLALRALVWMQERGINVGTVTMKMDNMEVVGICETGGVSKLPSRACSRNADLRLQLDALKEQFDGTLVVEYVAAHQDDARDYEELDFDGQRNADCDMAAGRTVREWRVARNEVGKFQEETVAMLWCRTGGVTEDPYARIIGAEARETVAKRLKMTARTMEKVDWCLHGKALSKIETRYRPGILKQIWEENPCKRKRWRDEGGGDDGCPLCGMRDEPSHFTRCSEVRGMSEWGRIKGNFRAKLNERDTSPLIVAWLMSAVEGEIPTLEEAVPLRYNQLVRAAYAEQASIGWHQLGHGRGTKKLVELQEWWRAAGEGTRRNKRENARETVAQAVAYLLLFRYEKWKLRCEEVVRRVGPEEERRLWEEVEEMKGKEEEMSAVDRDLFRPQNVPRRGDAKERLREWTRSARLSIERRKNCERAEMRDIRGCFERQMDSARRVGEVSERGNMTREKERP